MELLEKHFAVAFDSPNGIKELRSLILKLAMMGKLVPQDPKDQPASELLKEIQAEKEKLIAEGRIKRQKPLPEIKPEEILYELPEGWVWCRLGDSMIKITDGTHHSPPNTEKGEFFYISAKNIKADGVSLKNVSYVTKRIHEKIYSRCDPEFGEILYIKDGATTGIVTINQLREPFSMLSSVALLKQPDKVLNTFLLNLLKSPYFYNAMRSGMTGVAITRITLKKLINALIPLPPLKEQKRIVAKINELMVRCDEMERLKKEQTEKRRRTNAAALHRLIKSPDRESFTKSFSFITRDFSHIYGAKENVEELKKAVLQLAMMGKLVPQNPKDQPAGELLKEIQVEKEGLIAEGRIKRQKPLPEIKPEEIPYQLPAGWEWCRLGEVGEVQTGTTPPTNNPNYYGDYIPFIGPGDIQNSQINLNNNALTKLGMVKGRIIQRESILMVCIGGSIGKLAINPVNVTCNQQINALTPIAKNTKYLFYVLSSEYFQNAVMSFAGGSATPIINKNKWAAIIIPLPPLNEQKRIASKINELMNLCDSMIEKIDGAEETREKLLQSVLAQV